MAEALVELNTNWRIADDPPQWTIEQRIGNASAKDTGWRARKFIRDTDHLLRRIGEMCGYVGPAAIETIQSWPNEYVTWKAMEMRASARPKTGPYSAIVDQQHLGAPGIAEAPVCTPYGLDGVSAW